MLGYRCSVLVTLFAAAIAGFLMGCPSVSSPFGNSNGTTDNDAQTGRGNTSASASAFVERWESVAWERRAPGGPETFNGDAGSWYLGDTTSNFGDCGPTRHAVLISTCRKSATVLSRARRFSTARLVYPWKESAMSTTRWRDVCVKTWRTGSRASTVNP